ncbi:MULTISPECIES: winged helix-turn-helix domain-containing protein [unclassified Microbacterium]|uniref:winged helix-turn-helix domain-containing protein n=1 Tax=unclassified Microbacterium TaxID=2609290 RepID=UPI000A6DC928|nr:MULTISPECIES: winged helix-turn-helix domain-containing protein [unclassified Microbacterium]MBN9216274.1 response regulator transcription factor [Microbacterium sp.]
MTMVAEPLLGSARVVVLAPDDTAVRGAASEFRRFGLSLVLRNDIVAALGEVVHDPAAILVISSDIPCQDLRDVVDIAVMTCGSSVLLGLTTATGVTEVSAALSAGIRGIVDLPLTAERLARTLRTLPTKTLASGPITIGDLTVDARSHRIYWESTPIDASPREFAVMLELAQNHPHTVGLDQLVDAGGQGSSVDPHASVRVLINHVRSRIAQVTGARGSAIIETVRGVGYRLAG